MELAFGEDTIFLYKLQLIYKKRCQKLYTPQTILQNLPQFVRLYPMNKQKPIILNQAELDWETWDDPDLAAKSPVRWKILISGERDPSSQLSTGIAEMTPGTLLPLHHHAPAETYYVISGHGYVQ